MKNSRGPRQLDIQLLGAPQLASAADDQLPTALSHDPPAKPNAARYPLESSPGACAHEAAAGPHEDGAKPPEKRLAPGEAR
jgi:hypothetical protein